MDIDNNKKNIHAPRGLNKFDNKAIYLGDFTRLRATLNKSIFNYGNDINYI